MDNKLINDIKKRLADRGQDIDLAAIALIDLLVQEIKAKELILIPSRKDNGCIPFDRNTVFGPIEVPKPKIDFPIMPGNLPERPNDPMCEDN